MADDGTAFRLLFQWKKPAEHSFLIEIAIPLAFILALHAIYHNCFRIGYEMEINSWTAPFSTKNYHMPVSKITPLRFTSIRPKNVSRLFIRALSKPYPKSIINGVNSSPGTLEKFYYPERQGNLTLYEYHAYYVDSICAITRNEEPYYSNIMCQRTSINSRLNPSLFIGSYETVVAICHSGTPQFGHFFIDFIATLALFPPRLFSDAHFIVGKSSSFVVDALPIFGISRDRIVSIPPTGFLFAHQLYTVDPLPCNQRSAALAQRLRAILAKALSLDTIKPFRFVVFNRNTFYRKFPNGMAIFQNLSASFPSESWEYTEQIMKFREAAEYYNSVKLLFAAHGSNVANVMFMQPGSALCTVFFENAYDPNFIDYSLSNGVSFFFMGFPEGKFVQESAADFPVERAHFLVSTALRHFA